MQWNSQPHKCNLLDLNKNTPLHTSIKLAPAAHKYVPMLLEHGASASLQNAQGQTVLHLLAERAVRELQEVMGAGVEEWKSKANGSADGKGEGEGETGGVGEERSQAMYLPALRILDSLAELPLSLDATEFETGNTALRKPFSCTDRALLDILGE